MSSDLSKILGKSDNPHNLSSEDVCRIITTCRKNSVHRISYGELTVEFQPHSDTEPDLVKPTGPRAPRAKPMPESKIKEEEERLLLEANVLAREAELAQLAILQPEKYEELIAQGELEDGSGIDAGELESTE